MTSNALIFPVLCGVCGVVCGTLCGVKSLIYKACAVCAVSLLTGRAGACVRSLIFNTHTHTRKTHRHTAHTAHTAHPLHIKHLHVSPYRTQHPTYRT